MSKAPSPLLGYNNNVRHKNRVFHIQTEDSGIKHPHIITHLFMDGGRILKSVKTSYADHVADAKLGDIVRQMMKDQHKAMFRALREGELDAVVEQALGGRRSETSIPAPKPKTVPPPPVRREEPEPSTIREPAITLDLDAADPGVAFKPQPDLPPPPETVLAKGKEAGTGRYRTLEERSRRSEPPAKRKSERPRARPPSERPRAPAGAVREERASAARSNAAKADPRAEPPSEPKQPTAGKSARPSARPARSTRNPNQPAARPAAAFGPARPQQSIFGEDIISDKSLDEVILSYLAEDLDEKK